MRIISSVIAAVVSFFIGAALIILTRSFWGPLVVALVVYVFVYLALMVIMMYNRCSYVTMHNVRNDDENKSVRR